MSHIAEGRRERRPAPQTSRRITACRLNTDSHSSQTPAVQKALVTTGRASFLGFVSHLIVGSFTARHSSQSQTDATSDPLRFRPL